MTSSQSSPLRWIVWALRVILGVVFIYGGIVKLQNPWALFAMNIDSYHILPYAMLEPVARGLPWVEILMGLLLMAPGPAVRIVAPVMSATLVVFFAAMVHAKMTGQQINCGCFGPNEPISKWTFLRDGTLLAASLFVTVAAFRDPARKR